MKLKNFTQFNENMDIDDMMHHEESRKYSLHVL
jgi:hypothetical protein